MGKDDTLICEAFQTFSKFKGKCRSPVGIPAIYRATVGPAFC